MARIKHTSDIEEMLGARAKGGNPLIYARIDNFIRAVLRIERPFG